MSTGVSEVAAERVGSFRVLLTVQVKPGLEAECEKVWAEGSKEVTSQSANLGHSLARSAREDSARWVRDGAGPGSPGGRRPTRDVGAHPWGAPAR